MGYGDALMLSGLVRNAYEKNPDVQITSKGSERFNSFKQIFFLNPYITFSRNLELNKKILNIEKFGVGIIDLKKRKFFWKRDFPLIPGNIFFQKKELLLASKIILEIKQRWLKLKNKDPKKIIFINPDSKKNFLIKNNQQDINKSEHNINKEWPEDYWKIILKELSKDNLIIQTYSDENNTVYEKFYSIKCNFRTACSILNLSDIYLGAEGGLAHAAAALNKNAIVIFGSWISPEITGYSDHINLYKNSENEACGNLNPCEHCLSSMKKITPQDVMDEIYNISNKI